MQFIEYWAVEETYDRDTRIIACFDNAQAAELVARSRNNMYRSVSHRNLTLFDSVLDFENNCREKLRERALAKLTPEELQALGLTTL
jgi:hypothetical protein